MAFDLESKRFLKGFSLVVGLMDAATGIGLVFLPVLTLQLMGLDAGANDYVTKPFKFPVLLARIRAQLRQHEQSEEAIFQLGPYTFKPSAKLLITEDDKKIRLTEKETNILKFLYRAGAGVVPRDTLLHEVWGYNAGVTTHTLETHIYRLRQKIDKGFDKQLLTTVRGAGYMLDDPQ